MLFRSFCEQNDSISKNLYSEYGVKRGLRDEKGWAKKALLNTACSGKFTSDRTIQEYVDDIWHLDKVIVRKK